MIFLDTSAIYALADRADPNHRQAKEMFQDVLDSEEGILTHNYVLLESMVIIQDRLGTEAAVKLARSAPALEIVWIDSTMHEDGVRQMAGAGRRHSSLVDHLSFAIMRSRKLDTALAFDRKFEAEGFRPYRIQR